MNEKVSGCKINNSSSIAVILLSCFAIQAVSPAYALSLVGPQQSTKSDQRKKSLTDNIAYIEKRISENEEQAARDHLAGYNDTDNLYTEIKSKGLMAGRGQGELFIILAGMFEDFFKGAKNPAGTIKASQQTPSIDDPIKEAGFYDHPLVYFKHHINWVSQPEYDKKVNWPALQSDFETWKADEKQIKDLLDQHRQLEIEIGKVTAQSKETQDTIEARVADLIPKLDAAGKKAMDDEYRTLYTDLEKLKAQSKEEAKKTAEKIAELQKKMREIRDKALQVASFRGRYGFSLEPEGLGIARVVVLTQQTASDGGFPRFPYPFWKGVEVNTSGEPIGSMPEGKPSDDKGDADGDERLLYIIGRGLPANWSDPMNIVSDDPSIKYTVLALEKQSQGLVGYQKEAFTTGRKVVERNLDPETKTIADGLDAILIRATTKRGVVPGMKDFTVNNLEASWVLRFGDDIAEVSFAREVTAELTNPSLLRNDQVDLTDNIFLPEQVFIEVRTEVAFPLDEVRLKVQLNKQAVRWNLVPDGQPAGDPLLSTLGSITARFARYEPSERIIEVTPRPAEPAHLMKKLVAVYRTPLIELYKKGEAQPPAQEGVCELAADKGDRLMARLENQDLFRARSPLALADVYNDPSEIGFTWRHALTRAASLDGYDVKDWNNLEGQKAAEISNIIVTNIILPNSKPQSFARKLASIVSPVFSSEGKFFDGNVTEKTSVTIADHAALLLFKDAFQKQTQEALDQLEKAVDQDDRWEVGGWLDAIKPFAWDESHDWKLKNDNNVEVSAASSPWRYLRVHAPDGSEVPFAFALSDSYLDKTFGTGEDDRLRARTWTKTAGKEALIKYKEAIRNSIQKVKDTPDKDVAGLLSLLGVGYEALLPFVMPRLVRLGSAGLTPHEMWRPDLNARRVLPALHTVVDAVRAQQEFSKLDTQFLLAMSFAVATPFLFGAAATATVTAAAVEEFGANLGPLLVEAAFFDIPDAVRQRDEIQFALGAGLILGGNSLREAEVNRTEWFEIGLKILTSYVQGKSQAFGLGLGSFAIQRTAAWIRTALVLRKVRVGGLAALEKLSEREFNSLMTFITEAKALEKTDRLMMTSQQRAASALADQLVQEARAKANIAAVPKPRAPEPFVVAKGKPKQIKSETETVEFAKPEDSEGTIDYRKPGAPEYEAQGPRKFPNAPAPNSSFPTVDRTGKAVTFRLGELLGEGGYCAAYDWLDKNGDPTGYVIKIFQKEYEGQVPDSGKEIVTNTWNGSRRLADTSKGKAILQLPIKEYVPNAEQPYLIQKKLDKKSMIVFDYKPTVKVPDPANPGKFKDTKPLDRKSLAAFIKDEGLQEAVVELFYDLKEKGLIWEDCHLGNMFFVKEGDKWVAGILDQDRIIDFNDRSGSMGLLFGITEVFPFTMSKTPLLKIRSLKNAPKAQTYVSAYRLVLQFEAPFYPDAEFFMEKMFEHKDWIIYDPDTNQFYQQFLKPEIVRRRFPRLYEDAANPPDLRRPNRKTSFVPRPMGPERCARPATIAARAASWRPRRLFRTLAIASSVQNQPAITDRGGAARNRSNLYPFKRGSKEQAHDFGQGRISPESLSFYARAA